MNTTFWTWLAVAVGVGGVLLLLLATPATEQASPVVVEESATTDAATATAPATQYWSPVTGNSSYVQQPRTTQMQTQPCSTCGPSTVATTVPVVRTVPACPSCMQQPASACGSVPCSGLQTYAPCRACGTPCASTCPLVKPGINRNFDLCVNECSFIQLHTTIPQPICSNVCFEWSASKGSFLDPRASDPVFYAPTTQFPSGEDVWIVVKITDGTGAQYTDQVKVHVVDDK
jgi:hypothetical protein